MAPNVIHSLSFLRHREMPSIVLTSWLSHVEPLISSQFFNSLCLLWLETLQGNSILKECLILRGIAVNLKGFIHVFQGLGWEPIEDSARVWSIWVIRVRSFMVSFRRTVEKLGSLWHPFVHLWFFYFIHVLISSPVERWNWACVEKLVGWCSDLRRVIVGASSFPANLLVVVEDWGKGIVHFFFL